MFNDNALNGVSNGTLKNSFCDDSYAEIAFQASVTQGSEQNKIIFFIVSYALDILEDDVPLSVTELEGMIDDFVQGLIDQHTILCEEARKASFYRIGEEAECTKKIGTTKTGLSLNFAKCEEYYDELVKGRADPEMIEAVGNVVVSNRLVKELCPKIVSFADQLLACENWRASGEYAAFIASYAVVRKNTVMAERDITKFKKFNYD